MYDIEEMEHYSKKIKQDISSYCSNSTLNTHVKHDLKKRKYSSCATISSNYSKLTSRKTATDLFINGELNKFNKIDFSLGNNFPKKIKHKKLEFTPICDKQTTEKFGPKSLKFDQSEEQQFQNENIIHAKPMSAAIVYDSFNSSTTDNSRSSQNIDLSKSPIIGSQNSVKKPVSSNYIKSRPTSNSLNNSSIIINETTYDSLSPVIKSKTKRSSYLTKSAPHLTSKTFSTDNLTRRRLFSGTTCADFNIDFTSSPSTVDKSDLVKSNQFNEGTESTTQAHTNSSKLVNYNFENKKAMIENIKQNLNLGIGSRSFLIKTGKKALLEKSIITNVSTVRISKPQQHIMQSNVSVHIDDKCSEELLNNCHEKKSFRSKKESSKNSILSIRSATPDVSKLVKINLALKL